MNTVLPSRRAREIEILVLLQQGPRLLGAIAPKVSFTRHECRVRQLLFGLWAKGDVRWTEEGQWRLTIQGARAVTLGIAS